MTDMRSRPSRKKPLKSRNEGKTEFDKEEGDEIE